MSSKEYFGQQHTFSRIFKVLVLS